jgi:ribonuclease Z
VVPEGPAVELIDSLLDPWTADIAIRAEHTGRSDRPELALSVFEATPDPSQVWSAGDVVVSSVLVHHEPVIPAVAYRIDTPEASVVISGDTRACDEVRDLSRGVDVLVHEVGRLETFAEFVKGTFREQIFDYHCDTHQLGALAAEAGVGQLMLTHFIPPPRTAGDLTPFVDEVRAGGYEGPIHAGDDLLTVTLD